jgi:hypothetical protein
MPLKAKLNIDIFKLNKKKFLFKTFLKEVFYNE